MKKYKTEFKLKVVKSFLAGEGGAKLLARQWSVPEEKIRTWVSHYRLHGLDGLRPKRSAYSEQFKLQVLSYQDREQLSSRQVAAVYDIRNPNQVVVWRRNLQEVGLPALGSTKKGHPTMKPERRSPALPDTVTSDSAQALLEENKRLRAEVAYLKKLQALIRAKKRSRNFPGISDVHVPNVLQRDFCATAPNQKWATDITEFNVRGHKLYLSACMDLYNGEIIAHRMARRPAFDLVSGTLGAALSRAGHTGELTVHSDQGWHYKMQPYRTMLARCGVTQSMSRKGNCLDNAVIESLFGTLKAEYFYLATLDSLDELEAGVHNYIYYYNHERIKLGLQGVSPVEYRLRNTA